MKANLHTHTTYCDGNNTPEEVVLSAIDKGFSAIGFSSHGYTPYDLRYCMKDVEGYIAEVTSLKEKYRDKIEVYLGIEEDAFEPSDRSRFDYIIGSCHYFLLDGKYYPIDSDYDYFKAGLKAFGGDVIKLSENYYENFCKYIKRRKPDIIGHFDLITKFDEVDEALLLSNKDYLALSEKYVKEALKSGSLFELNTGAISRGYRKAPYPYENLLHIINKEGGGIILSSDSHDASTLDFYFEESKKLIKDIGFSYIYTLSGGEFIKGGLIL